MNGEVPKDIVALIAVSVAEEITVQHQKRRAGLKGFNYRQVV
jgi:hypothetical protein